MNFELLLVEDDEDLGAGLKRALEFHCFRVVWEKTGKTALSVVSTRKFSACVLDLGLPDLDGATIISDLRSIHPAMPVIVLTARDLVREKVRVLNLGADDYIVKPVELEELVARIQAVARRASKSVVAEIRIGEVIVDAGARSVHVGDRLVNLTAREFDVLVVLAQSNGRVVSRETIRTTLERWPDERDSNIVDVHIHNIRKKLGADLILTMRGIGYMIKR